MTMTETAALPVPKRASASVATLHKPAHASATLSDLPTPTHSQETCLDISPRIGDYRVDGIMGGDGLGDVMRCWDTRCGRPVALKLLKAEYADRVDLIEQFLYESQVLSFLEVPGIPKSLGSGRDAEGRPYFTTEYTPGMPLSTFLSPENLPPRNLTVIIRLLESTLQPLAHAHELGVIHRNLKPEHIQVFSRKKAGVLGWGQAGILGMDYDPPSKQGVPPGSPEYMSPEQAMGSPDSLAETADVFAVGAILCEILTGHPPFAADRLDGSHGPHTHSVEAAFDRLASREVDRELGWLGRWCLDPLPSARPANLKVVAGVLRGWLSSQPDAK